MSRWRYDHFDMPSGDGKPSRADKLWARQQEALRQQEPVRGVATCQHCGRPLLLSETDYCAICAIDISHDNEEDEMPRRPLTPAEKKAISKRMKARWRKAKHTQADINLNGSVVEQRVVLHLQGQTIDVPMTDAKALRDALDLVVPKAE